MALDSVESGGCRLKESVQMGLKKACKVQRLRHPQPALKQRLARPCVDILVPGAMAGCNEQIEANEIRKSLIIKPTWRNWQTR